MLVEGGHLNGSLMNRVNGIQAVIHYVEELAT